jgi:phage shock protein A
MFENLRNAFREAVENFNKELDRDQIPETVDRLLGGMRDEVAEAQASVHELEDQIARTQREIERETDEVATARRRGKLAADIEDTETAEIAQQYATKHEERLRLLEQKVTALRAELDFQRKEVDGMMQKFKEAKAKRDSLGATAGRTEARSSLRDADDLFSELDRMAEKIDGKASLADAEADLDPLDLHIDADAPPRREVDVDAALEELKRRMGKE